MENGQQAMTLRERQKAQTKAHLLSVVTSLIAEKGFVATSIDDIAKAAGTSRATVYSYFETKDGILTEIMRQMWDDANDMYRDFGELEDWTTDSVRGWVESVAKRWEGDAVRNRAAVEVGSGMLLQHYPENHNRHIESLTLNTELWLERFTAEQTRARASMLISLIETHMVNPKSDDVLEAREALINVMTDVWLDVLRART